MNSLHPRIKFTSENLNDNKIAFLDTEVVVKEDNTLNIEIYKKPTNTDQYLAFSSNHHMGQKIGIISTLKYRIETLVTEEDDKKEEEEKMKKSMRICGYPEWTLNKKKTRNDGKKVEWRGKVVVPYVKTISEKIARTFKKYNIQKYINQ